MTDEMTAPAKPIRKPKPVMSTEVAAFFAIETVLEDPKLNAEARQRIANYVHHKYGNGVSADVER